MVNLSKASFKLNNPLPSDILSECRKCADIIDHFVKPEKGQPIDKVIPKTILSNAKGVAIITVIKAGFIFTGRGGSGLVIARLPDGRWSAPSAISTGGIGVGGQIGAEVTDFVIILNTDEAVKAFSMGGNFTLGGNLSVSAGVFGRNAEAAAAVGHIAPIYSYSKSKGLFAGCSIEGTVIIERKEANANFYGRQISAKELLSGSVEPPRAAECLYRSLDRVIEGHLSGSERSSPVSPYSPYSPRPTNSNQSPKIGEQPFAANLNYQSLDQNTRPNKPAPPIPKRKLPTAVALYDYEATAPTDLSFKAGDRIQVTEMSSSTEDWWKGIANGKSGDFPANYVQLE